jgi:hypothetical protein
MYTTCMINICLSLILHAIQHYACACVLDAHAALLLSPFFSLRLRAPATPVPQTPKSLNLLTQDILPDPESMISCSDHMGWEDHFS